MRLMLTVLWFACLCSSASAQVRIVVLGDATTSGYMLNAADSFAAQLQRHLNQSGNVAVVMDESTPSATTADAYAALPKVLERKPDIVIVAVGTNDAARGLDINDAINTNLHYILFTLKQQRIGAVLLEVKAPAARKKAYQNTLANMYESLVFLHQASLVKDAYRPWRDDKTLSLADGVYPNAKGIAVLVKRVMPQLHPLILWAQKKRKPTVSG